MAKAEKSISVEEALLKIFELTDADDPNSHRSDDPETCLDAVHAIAGRVLKKPGFTTGN